MFNTGQALGVALIALLPGAAYTFAFERVAGSFGAGASDRIIRFLTASAALHALFAGLTYYLYQTQVHSGRLREGEVGPLVVEIFAITYVGVPTALGWLVGFGKDRQWRWAKVVVGTSPEPRAWDYLWSRKPTGTVRLRMKSGVYLGGLYGGRPDGVVSYAAGYPQDGDIFIARTLAVDAETGEFILDKDGRPQVSEGGVLLRWEEIEYLELFEQ